jgi:hypothetical protein
MGFVGLALAEANLAISTSQSWSPVFLVAQVTDSTSVRRVGLLIVCVWMFAGDPWYDY